MTVLFYLFGNKITVNKILGGAMKRYISIMISMALILLSCVQVYSADESGEEIKDIKPFDVEAESAVLMEAKTGRVLYAKSAGKALPPASVTKVMTLLLVMEEIDSGKMKLSDMISVSEYAASMGGSQVFLEAGEEMSLEDMLKSVVISSANDAAVALAEAVAGSEEAFVAKMNEKAAELSMKSTHFENVTGLDDDTKDHKMSAYDIAVASRELICSHPSVLKYSSIWMDTIRGGEFGLSNTNRLIRFYKGATGLKTGSTSKAGFCISATAERDGMHLIAVIMGSETRDTRNEAAKKLLDHGFANYCIYEKAECSGEGVRVIKGDKKNVKTMIDGVSLLIDKKSVESIEIKTEYMEKINAPVKKGDVVGTVEYILDGKVVGEGSVRAAEDVGILGFGDILIRLINSMLLCPKTK